MIKPISFGYKSVLKTQYLNGNMPEVKKGFYGGILTPDNVTLEHVLPHSKGGKTTLSNLALSVNENNWKRGNKPLIQFFSQEAFDEYIEQFRLIHLANFDGESYIKALTKTINRILKRK